MCPLPVFIVFSGETDQITPSIKNFQCPGLGQDFENGHHFWVELNFPKHSLAVSVLKVIDYLAAEYHIAASDLISDYCGNYSMSRLRSSHYCWEWVCLPCLDTTSGLDTNPLLRTLSQKRSVVFPKLITTTWMLFNANQIFKQGLFDKLGAHFIILCWAF